MEGSGEDAMTADMWRRLERGADAFRAPARPSSPSEKTEADKANTEPSRRRRKRTIRRLNLVASLFWPYAVLKLFVADVDRKILEALSTEAGDLVDYRAFVYLAVLIATVVTFKKKTALYLLYIAIFPIIVLCWKLPRAIARQRSWLLVISIVHVLSTVVTSLRYNIVTKGVAVFALVAATIPYTPVLIVPGCVYLVSPLIVAYFRSIHRAFSQSQFLKQQERLISFVVAKNPYQLDKLAAELSNSQLELYPKSDVDQFTTALNLRIIWNYGLY